MKMSQQDSSDREDAGEGRMEGAPVIQDGELARDDPAGAAEILGGGGTGDVAAASSFPHQPPRPSLPRDDDQTEERSDSPLVTAALEAHRAEVASQAEEQLRHFCGDYTAPLKTFPVTRVRAICRTMPSVTLLATDPALLITRLVEMFCSDVAFRASLHAKDHDRQTILSEDIVHAIQSCPEFDFLTVLIALKCHGRADR